MEYENLNIEIKDISPSKSFMRSVHEVAEKIHWQSPSDAYLKLVCEKSKEAIKTSCRIASQVGIFVAEAVGDCPEESLKKLEQIIQKKLNTWKQNRFSNFFNNQFDRAC